MLVTVGGRQAGACAPAAAGTATAGAAVMAGAAGASADAHRDCWLAAAATATGAVGGPKMFVIKREPSNGALKAAA